MRVDLIYADLIRRILVKSLKSYISFLRGFSLFNEKRVVVSGLLNLQIVVNVLKTKRTKTKLTQSR